LLRGDRDVRIECAVERGYPVEHRSGEFQRTHFSRSQLLAQGNYGFSIQAHYFVSTPFQEGNNGRVKTLQLLAAFHDDGYKNTGVLQNNEGETLVRLYRCLLP